MPVTARRSRSTVPDVVGSHQSEAEVEAMMPEQHQVLADAAAGLAATTSKKATGSARAGVSSKTIDKSKKKLFKLPVGACNDSQAQSSPTRRRNGPNDKAILKFFRATYQKGEKQGKYSGAVYMQGKVRYGKGKNESFKTKAGACVKGQFFRFNDDSKLYSAKMANVKTAIAVREAMKSVSPEDEKDLNETAPTDQEIMEIFDFPEAQSNVINIISSLELNGVENVGIQGTTFDFKDDIKNAGWQWDQDAKFWLAQVGTDTKELEKLFTDYGFDVEHFDGVAGHSDADDDDDDEHAE